MSRVEGTFFLPFFLINKKNRLLRVPLPATDPGLPGVYLFFEGRGFHVRRDLTRDTTDTRQTTGCESFASLSENL